jgi:hypothetical protein
MAPSRTQVSSVGEGMKVRDLMRRWFKRLDPGE